MAAVKAKEKEMKDEKEAERQVGCEWCILLRIVILIFNSRGGYKPLKRRGQRKRRRLVMRSWQRRCTRSEWKD
jgi:hypothetical protein